MRLLLICLLILNLLALAAGFGLLGSSAPRGEPERLTNQINPEQLQLEPSAGPATQAAIDAARTEAAAAASAPPPAPDPVATPAPTSDPRPPPAATMPTPPIEPTEEPVTSAPVVAIEAQDPVPDEASVVAEPLICAAYAGVTEPRLDALRAEAGLVDQGIRITAEQTEPPASWWVRIPPAETRADAETRARQLRALGVSDLFVVRDQGPNQNAISLGLFRTETSARQHLSELEARQVAGAEIAARIPAVYSVQISGPATAVTRLSASFADRLGPIVESGCR
ncbi:SPOR domain-containing protein [Rhodocyclaceae bacterium SMB388]